MAERQVLGDGQAADAYSAGALSAVPAEREPLIACLGSVARQRREIWATEFGPARRSAGFARLRRGVADLRSGLLSATVALNLMNVISESVERAIMFLVRDRRLVALGAFGTSMSGLPLARLTTRLELDFDSPNALSEAIDDAQARAMGYFGELEHPEAGPFETLEGPPFRIEGTPLGPDRPAPLFSADAADLLRELGLDATPEQIAKLGGQ